MTGTAQERRIAALRERADHPGTPPAEAAACRARLAAMDSAQEPEPERCGLCTRLSTDRDPQWLSRWQSLRRRGYVTCDVGCAP
ncbi:Uncharacterised protein [Mycobacteroides abscessus subsp. abscessus]|uniref:hypothetical protein n=1 Tax=Mycobacteroides abscessus TaxID=36809 RepID=UPI0009D29538|nr:hypothetical protein [Mycobacteroides abscessus]SLJ22805.1 Uncharacterised protein [Mycobacteroides abscessus subsp. abscessus]